MLLLTAARLVWLVWFSDYTLIEDEAHYWEWSRRLDWSYYSKGPGVAWAIAASTAFFGHVEWAVRLPAVLAGAVGSLAVALLTREVVREHTRAHPAQHAAPFVAALLYQCVPAIGVTGVLMTIDGPFLACWALAAWGAARALLHDRPRAWAICGGALAIGFLFKYTIVLLVPGIIAAVLARAAWRRRARAQARWIALGSLLALLGLVPVIVWNAQHDWSTVRHLLGHLGAPGGDVSPDTGEPWTPLRSLAQVGEYLGLFIAMGGPVLVLGVIAWFERRRLGAGLVFATACSLPIALVYLGVSVFAEVEGNWAIATVVVLVAPSAWLVIDGVSRRDVPVRCLWGAALFTGLVVALALPILPTLSRVGRMGARIPVHRMTGMHEHAAAAQAELDALRAQTGHEPFVIAAHYGRASQLAFYLPGHPTVYCSSAYIGGRRTQYDVWPETDLADPDTIAHLHGRPALILGGQSWQWAAAFDPLYDLGPLAGEPKANRTAFVGYDYADIRDYAPGWWADAAEPKRPESNPDAPEGPP
ncbi:MAG: dolichyl-phosphate-mannose--protein mannosyltransferase [Phycisphaeraceae bacterium]|nr:MAG: dolichyl-phosphate-mannose--protein mannosyltransferase [Phycisphaeraceae bacterium]